MTGTGWRCDVVTFFWPSGRSWGNCKAGSTDMVSTLVARDVHVYSIRNASVSTVSGSLRSSIIAHISIAPRTFLASDLTALLLPGRQTRPVKMNQKLCFTMSRLRSDFAKALPVLGDTWILAQLKLGSQLQPTAIKPRLTSKYSVDSVSVRTRRSRMN